MNINEEREILYLQDTDTKPEDEMKDLVEDEEGNIVEEDDEEEDDDEGDDEEGAEEENALP